MNTNAGFILKTAWLVLCLSPFTAFVYAGSSETAGKEMTPDHLVPSVSAEELKGTNVGGEDLSLPSFTSSTDFLSQRSSFSRVAIEAPKVFVGKYSELEASVLIDAVLSQVINKGWEGDWSRVLTYLDKKDYSGLASFQMKHPKILFQFINALELVSSQSLPNSPSKIYVDHWLEQARRANEVLLQPQSPVYEGLEGSRSERDEGPVAVVRKLYQPIEERIFEMKQSLEAVRGVSENTGKKGEGSGDFLRNFSDKAKELILNSLDRAQTNLANGALSSPLETTAFAAEVVVTEKPSVPLDSMANRKMTIAETYLAERSGKYRVVDSVFIGKDFIYAQRMLHPPASLHPYLKWLLYTRNLTPRMMEKYLVTREAVGAIYAQAKAGQGNIRYRGRVYGAFLPFAETTAGNYELVKPAFTQ